MREIGIYLHIPFCKKKCDYCDFVSFSGKETKMEEYVEALKKEIRSQKREVIQIKTIYFGGGTPSILPVGKIKELLEEVRNIGQVEENAEITIEVNPGMVTKEKLREYLACGINRISIGLQTTNDVLLQQIGRIHTYETFLKTYREIKEMGFTNKNIDLMLALPNQEMQDLRKSIKEIIALNPEHISIYSLILEEGTKLFEKVEKKECILPKDEIERKMYWQVKKELEKAGYQHYEISNFAKPGYESKHNNDCWKQKEYLGFGVAAYSYFDGVRYSNTEQLEEYIKNVMIGNNEKIKQIQEVQGMEEKQKEFMLLGLRRIDGVRISDFKTKFIQNPIYTFRKEWSKLVKQELIEIEEDSIKLTRKGLDFANLVFEEFV